VLQRDFIQPDVILSAARAGRGTLRLLDGVDAVDGNARAACSESFFASAQAVRDFVRSRRRAGARLRDDIDQGMLNSIAKVLQRDFIPRDVILSAARAGRGTLRPVDPVDAVDGSARAACSEAFFASAQSIRDFRKVPPARWGAPAE
jgi:aminoglycoside/choline kinase family phosphotransferase